MYVNNLVGDIKAKPRDFYRYIKSQKKDTQGIPPLKRKNDNGVAKSELEQADEFNCQFTDVFIKIEHSQVPLPNRSAPFMNDIVVSAVGVTKLLKGLNPSKALGPDELRKTFSKFYRRHYELVSKFNVGLKTLLHQGLSEPEFYGDLVYKFKKIVGRVDFSDQSRKIIVRYKRSGYNINIMRQSAC